MPKLEWDKTGERFYEAGVDQGVVYPMENGAYGNGVAWNGLTAVNESPDGGELNDIYADNIKYLSLRSVENFKGSIEAYTYPDEIAECDGSHSVATGVRVGQQKRGKFGFSYRTKIGNDVNEDLGYKIHLVYGCSISPSDKNHETLDDNSDPTSFSWDFDTTPVAITEVAGLKPTAHIEIDSTKVDAAKLTAFLTKLYGGDSSQPTLPLPDEVIRDLT